MILLNEITIKNFLSHEDTCVTFKTSEKLLVDGKSGSGKSSITEALLWCLYGQGRSDNRSLVRKGSKGGATVSLKLNDGTTSFIITRSTTNTGKNSLTVTKKEAEESRYLPITSTGIKEIQEWIEKDFLKASYELFTNSVAYPQENENSFVKATASRRKDLLLEIVRAGNFTDLYEKTKNALNSKQNGMVEGLTKIKSLEELIVVSKNSASTYATHKETSTLLSSQIETIIMLEKDLEKQLNSISGIASQVSSNKKMKQMLSDLILKNFSQIDIIQKDITNHKNFNIEIARSNVKEAFVKLIESESVEKEIRDISLRQQEVNAHLSNRPSVFDYTKDIEEINKRLIALMKETGKCPAGDKCPFLATVKGQIEYLTGQIEDKAAKSVAEAEAFEKWEKASKLLPQVQDTTELYRKLTEMKARIKVLSESEAVVAKYDLFQNSLGDLEAKILSLQTEIDQSRVELMSVENGLSELEMTLSKFDINKINLDLANFRISKSDLQKRLDLANLGMAMATKAEETAKEASTALLALQNGIVESKEQVESLELLKEAFSPRGIKAVVVDYIIPQLEQRINNVLGELSEFQIRLDTQKALATDDGVKEGLFITIINDRGEELAFENYSGGEKVKIIIAISEALAGLMSQIGFRIMDENIVSLDKESTEGFVDVLEKLQDKFPQLLVISHLDSIKDIFEKKITVVKVDGVSRIKENE